jgi:hypothetical protein
MNKRYNILVFPCGSEIGLELFRSLQYSMHINLVGASSIDDHGRFVYPNYVNSVPFVDDPGFIPAIRAIVSAHNIDAIYPSMDTVITRLSLAQEEIGCKVIASPTATTEICLSKKKTYEYFKDIIRVPRILSSLAEVQHYPVFMKPEVGYGSRGAKLILHEEQGWQHLAEYPGAMILENLPGEEYTVDCFTDSEAQLLFSRPRKRERISNGISVRTVPVTKRLDEFTAIAQKINDNLPLRGAWFYQVKESAGAELVLLEIASRLAGSSALYRNLGVNFALLSIFDAFGHKVNVFHNDYHIELDRALNSKYKVQLDIARAYIDFDDCLLINGQVNVQLVALLYQFLNKGIKLILITKHDRVVEDTLTHYRLRSLFDEIIHLPKEDCKYRYIDPEGAIFIDDSFAERYQVHQHLHIPVFAPDNIECLLD